MLINAGRCWRWGLMLIIGDRWWWVLIIINRCCSMLMWISVDQGWPTWINDEGGGSMLIRFDQRSPMLTSAPRTATWLNNYWLFVDFKGFEVHGGWKSYEINAQPMEINWHDANFVDANEKHWESTEIDENQREINGNEWNVNENLMKVIENRWKFDADQRRPLKFEENR